MVVSNLKCSLRNSAFKELSTYIKVDSGGKFLNNVGGPVENKMDFIRNYKFVLPFENSSHAGYTTEKVFEPILEGCIPIYWENELISKDLNVKRILNYNNYKTSQALVSEMKEIVTNNEKETNILSQPVFLESSSAYDLTEDENLIAFLKTSIEKCKNQNPITRKINRIRTSPFRCLAI